MTSRSKSKGSRFELFLSRELTANGIPSEKVPLSGSLGGRFSSDVVIGTCEHPLGRIECKNRESLSKTLWEWLKGVDYLALKRNNYEPLIVMTLDEFIKLKKAEYE